jgi:protein SCO1
MSFRFLFVLFFLFSCNHINPSKDRIPDFKLVDIEDRDIEFYKILENKKLSLVFFGYSHCPNVCYNTLHKFDLVLQKLNPIEISNLEIIFISIDSKRDNKESLRLMKRKTNPYILFLYGNERDIDIVKKAFNVKVYQTQDLNEKIPTLIHSTTIFVIDKNKKLIHKIPEEIQSDDIAKFITTYLRN